MPPDLLREIDDSWRTANYLSADQIDLYEILLLKWPLTLADGKQMLLEHWDTTAGENFMYVHLNLVIKKYELDLPVLNDLDRLHRVMGVTDRLKQLDAEGHTESR